ncbi:glutamine amidotransferase [Dehalobacter sp. DCM]|uniref:type 1 glutamine amidotransferase n=1 Tax=Dehalobacter sp. DCM TaxID=2907827 RepID=UPI003081B108|nr:glutamine amidotransferase [Dehalobacter sp. DCM]
MKLVIYHLYPDLLDLYGDRGNVAVLAARCQWRGIDVEIRRISLGESVDFSTADIIFLGGGSDREQNLLVADLSARSREMKAAIEDGLVLLTICGGYQLLGQYYQTGEGKRIPGLEILDFNTVAGNKRLIGNVIIEIDHDLRESISEFYTVDNRYGVEFNTLVGFENHSGKTYLGQGLKPLGKVIQGYGNNSEDESEGVRYKNVFGTYLHGPLLPKNPHMADLLLGLALKRRYGSGKLERLEDQIETAAHQAVVSRFLT